MELLTLALDRTRFSKAELNKVMISAYQEACKPMPISSLNTPSDPHPVPPSKKAIGATELVHDCDDDENGEYIEGLEELWGLFTATDSSAPTTQIISPASPPIWPESGPCVAGLDCRGYNKCPCPVLAAQVLQISSPSSPVDLSGVQAQPCMAGLECKGKCPCTKRVTFLYPPHRIVPPKYKPDRSFCDGLCEGTSKPCKRPILKQSEQHISVAK